MGCDAIQRQLHNTLRNAAEEQVWQPCAAASAHDDEINLLVLDDLNKLVRRNAKLTNWASARRCSAKERLCLCLRFTPKLCHKSRELGLCRERQRHLNDMQHGQNNTRIAGAKATSGACCEF